MATGSAEIWSDEADEGRRCWWSENGFEDWTDGIGAEGREISELLRQTSSPSIARGVEPSS